MVLEQTPNFLKMNTIYIDIECDNNRNVIEIAAIKIKDNVIKKVLHNFIKQENTDTFCYRRTAENSHCIPHHILKRKRIDWVDYTTDFYLLFTENDEKKIL